MVRALLDSLKAKLRRCFALSYALALLPLVARPLLRGQRSADLAFLLSSLLYRG